MDQRGPAPHLGSDFDPLTHPLLRDVPTHAGFKVLGPAVITGVVGHGGMGVVFRGRHLRLGVPVAIKCMDPRFALQPDFATRFRREANAAALIQHNNVVRVYDVEEQHGVHFIIMELVVGEHARARVKRKEQLEIDEALEIALGAARGLAAAHERDVLHRDIKPDNLLISTEGEVKIVDMGLAKPVASDGDAVTHTETVFGTPQYMPPEQWGGVSQVGASGDVWALGATLYFLLTGKDALPKEPAAACGRVLSGPFPDPRELRSDVPAGVAELVRRCTEIVPEQRPQNGAELVQLMTPLAASVSQLSREAPGHVTIEQVVSESPSEVELNAVRASLDAAAHGRVLGGGDSSLTSSARIGRRLAWLGLPVVALGAAGWFLWPDSTTPLDMLPAVELDFDGGAPVVTNQDWCRVSGRVLNATADSVTWNSPRGGDTTIALGAEGEFEFEVPLRDNETHALEVRADGAQRVAAATLVHDTVAPSIRVLRPIDRTVLRSDSVDIEVTLAEANPEELTLAGREFERQADNTWLLSKFGLNEGEQTLRINAIDLAGNESAASLTLVLDRTPPKIVSIEPALNVALNDEEHSFKIEVDEPLAKAALDGVDLEFGGNEAWGEAWLSRFGDDFVGELLLIDTAGNERSQKLTYAMAPEPEPAPEPPPTSGIESITELAFSQIDGTGSIAVRGSSFGPPAELRARLVARAGDRREYLLVPLVTDTTSEIDVTLPVPDDLPDGDYELAVSATHGQEVAKHDVRIDRTPPLLDVARSRLGTRSRPLVHRNGTISLDVAFDEPAQIFEIDDDGDLGQPHTTFESLHSSLSLPFDNALLAPLEPTSLALLARDRAGNELRFEALVESQRAKAAAEAVFPPITEVDWRLGTFSFTNSDGVVQRWRLPAPGARIVSEPTIDQHGVQSFRVRSGNDTAEMVLITGGALNGPPGLTPYLIDRFEVTSGRFNAFATSTGDATEAVQSSVRDDASVAGISGEQALAFAAWADKRLPNVEQWRAAAGWDGASMQRYSWGSTLGSVPLDLEPGQALLSVDLMADRSPFGVYGMGVGLSEWCDNVDSREYLLPVMGGTSYSKFINENTREHHFKIDEPLMRLHEREANLVDIAHVGFRCILPLEQVFL